MTIPVGGAPGDLAFGAGSLWVADGDARAVSQVSPAPTGSCSGSRRATRRARIVAGSARCGWPPGPTERSAGIDLRRGSGARRSIIGANPTRARRRRRARCGWRARRGAPCSGSSRARARVVSTIPVGHGPIAWRSGEGAVWVVEPPGRDGLAHRPGATTRSPAPSGGTRSERGRGRRGRGVGGGRRRRDRVADRPRRGRACSSGRGPRAARRRSPSPTARCGPRRSRRRRRIAAERCGRTYPFAGSGPPRTGCTRQATSPAPGWCSLATTASSPTGAPGARPGDARRRSGHRGAARRAPTGAPTSSRCDADRATPTARPVRPGRLPRVDGALPARHAGTPPAVLPGDRRRAAVHAVSRRAAISPRGS